ncbi:MAG: polysaccharide export protein [Acidobacteriota bacterium]|nr:polysaccharide export protein [Acidobacteriota bacterium]
MRKQKSSWLNVCRPDIANIPRTGVVIALCAATSWVAAAKQPDVNILPAFKITSRNFSGTASSAPQADDRYRIGAGDVLEVRVFNRPQLSRDAVRVDGRGTIRMPLIEGEIQAACRTEGELARDIADRYLKYQRNPQVDVFVKEYQSQPVAVIGAVNAPGRFQLQRRVRLLELLAFAGGPAERAGRGVQVVHTAATTITCETPTTTDAQPSGADAGAEESIDSFNLSDVLRGDNKANLYVRPGDIITILDAEQAFVVGNVLKPSTIPLKEPITVSRAIAMAGGTMPDTKSNKIRIIRQALGSASRTEIMVDLEAIDKRRAEDVVLQANDIIDVPTSSGKRFLRNIVSSIAPAVGQLPVQVVR